MNAVHAERSDEIDAVTPAPDRLPSIVMFDHVETGGRRFDFPAGLRARREYCDGTWVLGVPEFNLVAHGGTIDEARQAFGEYVAFLWDEYAAADDADLTADAIALKQRVLAAMKPIEVRTDAP